MLGELRVDRDGEQLTLPRRRPARLLLGWLALHPGAHARGTVAARLWPNVLDASARTSLRTSMSALRAVIGPEALVGTRERVGLAEGVWVDARDCDLLLAANRPLEALELCHGELLAGFDEEWVLSAREAHRIRVADVLEQLASAAAAGGDPRAALDFARRRVALDLLDEAAHRDLMRLLTAGGDRAGALALYERFADRLRRELGVAPSPATRSLVAELRGGVPPAAPVLPLPARITAARQRQRLVGRDAELTRLRAAWARSGRHGRRLALVSGEPGIGKTRLVAEFGAEIGGLGVVVLYGRAEEEALVPYQPFVESLREPVRHGIELPLEAAELSALLPETAQHPDRRPVPTEPSPAGRLRLFEAVGLTLDALAADRPLLLVLDDLHWAEPPTIRLLRYLAARPAASPRMIVATYRDTEEHPFAAAVADLYRDVATESIGLTGLDRDAVAELTGGDRSPALVRTLCEQTGGNPFFIEQVLPGDPIGVSETVSRRVAALGAEAHAVLDAAAVSGAEFELAVAAEVVGLPIDDTLDVLDAAVKGRLITEVPGEAGRFAFVHTIVRDTLSRSLTAARRARLHELFATALNARADREPDRYLVELANHALEAASGAGDPIVAAALARRAAGRAGAVLAHEDAATLLSRAVAVLARRGDASPLRAELQCLRGEALQRAGLSDEAEPAFAQTRELARAAGRADLIARAALGLGGAGVTILGTDSQRVAALQEALDGLGDDHLELQVKVLARLAIELAYEPDTGRRDAISDQALALAHRTDDAGALAAALNARHVIAWGPDGADERLRVANEMLAVAEHGGDSELALQARHWRIVDLLELGDGRGVRDALDLYAELSARVRLPAFAWYVPMWRATLALLEGRIDEGLELSRRARDLGRQAGDANADLFFSEQYFTRMVVQGRISDVDPLAGGVVGEVAERAERGPAWRAYRFTFAWWHAARGELEEARRDFDAALSDGFATIPRDVNWLASLTSAAEACVLLGDVERAGELRALLAPYATRMVVTARGSSHGGSVAFQLAQLAALCDDVAEADRLFEDAARRDERAGAPAWVIRDLQRHGEFLRAAGQLERGEELLRHASANQGRQTSAD